jgi:hypothetical protein
MSLNILKKLIKEGIEDFVSQQQRETISFEDNPLEYILQKYPSLDATLVDLLTENYRDYITGVYVIAPKPTTFRILLHNGQEFYLIYGPKAYTAKISGKKYNLINLNEEQFAITSIAALLELGMPPGSEGPGEQTDNEADFKGGEDESPSEETPSEEPAGDEEELQEVEEIKPKSPVKFKIIKEGEEKKTLLNELKLNNPHWEQRVNERGTILDIINFPKNSLLSKQEVINSIQDELSKRISKLEKLEKFPISLSHNIGYKLMKPILRYNNKNLPLQLKVKYSNNNVEKQGIGTSYIVIIWDNTLITLLLKDEDDNTSIISNLETHQQLKDRTSPSKILTTSDYEFIISPKNDIKIKLINPNDLLYKLKTDYRKGGDFEHSQYGKGVIINTSAGSGGKGDSKGYLDWVDVDFKKPYVKNGKFFTTRRISNIYTKVSPNINSSLLP